MKKYLIIGTFLLALPLAVAAQTPSPSSSAGPIRDAVKDQVAKELSNIKQAVANKAYVGSIASKADLTLTITNLNNQTRTATVTADATIKLTGGKDGTPADLKVGDFVIVMGPVDSNGLLTAKRVLVISLSAPDKRAAMYATVSKASTSSLTVTNLKNETWTVKLSSSTKYTAGSKASDIKEGSKLIAVGVVSANNALTASIISILPVK